MVNKLSTFMEFVQAISESDIAKPRTNLGIDRKQMPQISSQDVNEFISYLKSLGHAVTKSTLPIIQLKMTQKEFNDDKVKHLMKKGKSQLSKPVIVSKDNYLLDGHHRFLALYNLDSSSKIPVVKVDVAIHTLLNLAKSFPKTYSKSIHESI